MTTKPLSNQNSCTYHTNGDQHYFNSTKINKKVEKLKYKIIENGYFVPQGIISEFDLVYDSNRNIVLESTLRRGEHKEKDRSEAPAILPSNIKSSHEYNDETLLFLGWYDVIAYGHWLTEGLARYWYLLDQEKHGLKIPTASTLLTLKRKIKHNLFNRRPQHWKAGIDTFGILSDDFLHCSKPIQAKKIIVPECSMHNWGEIRDEHLQVTQRIAQHMINIEKVEHDLTPIYLSRTKLKQPNRSLNEENKVEDYCKSIGFKVVYPEQLSLVDQITLFNTHDTFIGFVGSAFHSIMFRAIDRQASCVYLSDGTQHVNCKLIDSLMDNKATYIKCVEKTSSARKEYCLNSDKAIKDISSYFALDRSKTSDITKSR